MPIRLRGRLSKKPFGDIEELFLDSSPTPFLAQLQKHARSMHVPKATLILGGLKFEGILEVENQRRVAHAVHENRNVGMPQDVFEKRFRIGEWDCLSYLRDGVAIDLTVS